MRRSLLLLFAAALVELGCQGAAPPDQKPAPPVHERPVFAPSSPVMPRLTALQYRNSLKDVFGDALPASALEPDTNPYLFYSIGAATTTLSELGAEQYAESAAIITDAIFSDTKRRDALLRCTPSGPGDACTREFLATMGRRLFRRPLEPAEADAWVAVARDTAEGDAHRGIRLALTGMLQSPRFLYRVEIGEPIPDAAMGAPARRFTAYEMAERLSFLFWNTSPDDQLLGAAARGELLDSSSLHREAQRLLASPRARAAMQAFFDQYLDLGGLPHLDRDPARYPAFTKTLGAAMRTEIQLLADDFVFRRDADIRGLFSTRRTFVNKELAALYGLKAPGASEVAFVPAELPEDGPRGGLLTLGAFLAMNAHQTETSPTLRGKYVRERLLCELIPPPPGNINLDLSEMGGPPRTLRERLEEHRKNPSCYGCHALMDPPGFLFEGFDSIGVYRTHVGGIAVNSKSEIDGEPYTDGRDLGKKLATDPRVARCLVKQLYRHANARLDERGDEAALLDLEARFEADGYRFQSLLVALVQSNGFRTLSSGEVMP